jgi:2-oxoglutarate ferredoxin oxidoreductase subunit alpha
MSATAGPGVSLFSEHISFAIGSEIPMVIVNVQRLGPSTGSATRGADGDINFMRWGNSGGLPLIVLAPANVSDCFTLTMHAFNLAERFRCPVFVASNKEIGLTRESFDPEALERPKLMDRAVAPSDQPFLPFQVGKNQLVPDFLPIGGNTLVRQTSSTHAKTGYITTDTAEITAVLRRLKLKLESTVDQFSYYEFLASQDAETLIISYGVTARAAKAVYSELRQLGKPVSLLVLKTLWPIPEQVIRKAAEDIKRIVVVEMNLGQYVSEIERLLPDKRVDFVGQMNGQLINPQKIIETIVNG